MKFKYFKTNIYKTSMLELDFLLDQFTNNQVSRLY